ncbi:hypothetical protein V8C26DRAFT_398472 [Trichoderma gracile]
MPVPVTRFLFLSLFLLPIPALRPGARESRVRRSELAWGVQPSSASGSASFSRAVPILLQRCSWLITKATRQQPPVGRCSLARVPPVSAWGTPCSRSCVLPW